MSRKKSIGIIVVNLVILNMLIINLNAVGIDTTTYHGSNGARTGYFETNADNIDDSQFNVRITSDNNMVVSPVSALVKIDSTWYQSSKLPSNEEYVAICSENVISVYKINYNADNHAQCEFIWTYEFQSPIIGTPLTFTLEQPTVATSSVEALFIVTSGYNQGTIQQGNVMLTNYQNPELFLFDIKTGQMFLYYHTGLNGLVYSSPAILSQDLNSDGVTEFYIYFSAIEYGLTFCRVSFVKTYGSWKWSYDGINPNLNPMKTYTFQEPIFYFSYSSPAVVSQMNYHYNSAAGEGNELNENIGPYIIQPGCCGIIHALDWNNFDIPENQLDPDHPERLDTHIEQDGFLTGKYIHSSAITFTSPSTDMIEEPAGDDCGYLTYVDIGVDECYLINEKMYAAYARFIFYLEIYKDANEDYQIQLKFDPVNTLPLDYSFITSACALMCNYDSGLEQYYMGTDQYLFREFVESWEFDSINNKIKMNTYFIEAEEERMNNDGLIDGSMISIWTDFLVFQSYTCSATPPIIPSPICSDDYIIIVFGQTIYYLYISTEYINGNQYYSSDTDFYWADAVMTTSSLCLATPALVFQILGDAGGGWYDVCYQIIEITTNNIFYLVSLYEDYQKLPSYSLYNVLADGQWHGFQNAYTYIYDVLSNFRSAYHSGHMNCYIYLFDPIYIKSGHNWDTVRNNPAVGPANAIDPAISSPVCINLPSGRYIVSAQKNVLAIFDENLVLHWKRYLDTPVYGTPILIKDYSLGAGTINLLVVVTRGTHRGLTPFDNPAAQKNAKVYLLSLDGIEYDSYDIGTCIEDIDPINDAVLVYSSPLHQRPWGVIDLWGHEGYLGDFIFITSTYLQMTGIALSYTYYLFRFQITICPGGIDLAVTYRQKAIYGGGGPIDKWNFNEENIISYSSPTYIKWIEGDLNFLDDWALICFGTIVSNAMNVEFYRWDDFTKNAGLLVGGQQVNIRYSTPAVEYKFVKSHPAPPGQSRTYVSIGSDRTVMPQAVPPRLNYITITCRHHSNMPPPPAGWLITNIQSVDLDLLVATSPAYSLEKKYIFISTSDMNRPPGAQQLTNIYMIRDPFNGGALQILDSIVNVQSNFNLKLPVSIIDTNKDVYLPMGLKLKIAGIDTVNNEFIGGQCVDFHSLTPIGGMLYWSTVGAVLSYDTSVYTYFSNTGAEIRRWQPE